MILALDSIYLRPSGRLSITFISDAQHPHSGMYDIIILKVTISPVQAKATFDHSDPEVFTSLDKTKPPVLVSTVAIDSVFCRWVVDSFSMSSELVCLFAYIA